MRRFEETRVRLQERLVIRMVRAGLVEKIKCEQILEGRERTNHEDIGGSEFMEEETAGTKVVRHRHA